MKKIISLAMALVMCLAMLTTAFAADIVIKDDNPGTGDAIIKTSTVKDDGTTSGERYEVTIPAETAIPWEKTAYDVEYDVDAQLLYYHLLNVKAAGNNVMTFTTTDLAENKTYTLNYTLTDDEFETADPVFNGTAKVTVNVPTEEWLKVPVAEYRDTLTFTTSLTDLRVAP